ncbi:hypothetical protein, partial [Flavivirga aquatica]|uniref:hypothetical protein n=1 Tax=Flavivirga aquatica TaxID=1849968 RepID=UPI00196B257C
MLVNESLTDSGLAYGTSVLRINDEGLYERIKDSLLFNGLLHMVLREDYYNDTGPTPYGFLSGDIKDGKKEGEWEKEVFVKGEESAIVKVMNYANGVLHGKYQVFDLKGNVLTP